MAHKVCPVVFRVSDRGAEVLAFRHPSAGNQFVKGTIEHGELAALSAVRELREESGICAGPALIDLGQFPVGENLLWHFFALQRNDLPDRWNHRTEDDFGHTFSFFWHPLDQDLDADWHPQFHEVLTIIRRSLPLLI